MKKSFENYKPEIVLVKNKVHLVFKSYKEMYIFLCKYLKRNVTREEFVYFKRKLFEKFPEYNSMNYCWEPNNEYIIPVSWLDDMFFNIHKREVEREIQKLDLYYRDKKLDD